MSASGLQATSKQTEQVIYARVTEPLKAATDRYAADRGLTLAGAVSELLESGLEAEQRAARIASLEGRVDRLAADKSTLQSELHGARAELQAVGALGGRVRQTVGNCPNSDCEHPISGYDLLATGACPHCGTALSGLLLGKEARADSLNQQEFLLLIGALGALVGVALLAGKAT
ncbi:MAG TPA: hypothetical protein VLK89_04155 [Solirubrobacterales bacterium]|nr:hypothetical protein [Solirubrobacterales bacterium]